MRKHTYDDDNEFEMNEDNYEYAENKEDDETEEHDEKKGHEQKPQTC